MTDEQAKEFVLKLKAAKKEAEDFITSALLIATEKFTEQTGLSIQGVFISTVEVTTFDDLPNRKYILEGVKVDISLPN
jgi:hypothetical protein